MACQHLEYVGRPWTSASAPKFDLIDFYRPPQVRSGAIGVIVDTEERRTTFGAEFYVRARFSDFITPWIEAWKLARVS